MAEPQPIAPLQSSRVPQKRQLKHANVTLHRWPKIYRDKKNDAAPDACSRASVSLCLS